MDLTDDVVQQLRAKAKLLRSIADQLAAGEHLQAVVTKARDTPVWAGPPQTAFCAWLDDLDRWVREQLAPGAGKVAEEIDRHASDLDEAQRKLNSAVPGAACPAPACLVHWAPTRLPEFVMQVDRAEGAVSMAPPEMEGLVALLGHAKDAYCAVGRQLEEALSPPRYVVTLGSGPVASPSPSGTQVAAQLPPQGHIPPDGPDACGLPAIFPQALGLQLDRAMQDVLDRARKWAQAASPDSAGNPGGLFGWFAGLGAILAKAQAVAVPTTAEVSRQQGAGDAARFAAVALPKEGDCPGHDDLSRIVGEVRSKEGGNPAYAAGFSAALGEMHYQEYGVDSGNGFEWFSRKVELCGTGGHTHEQRWGDLHQSIGELFAMATHDPSFDIRLAETMANSWLGGGSYLTAGPLRTDVALMVADHWIKAKDWRKKTPPPRDIAAGLKVLTANPEAAYIYTLGHARLLTKGTNPDLVGTEMSALDPTAALAADVLRIGLVEYPAQLAAVAESQRDTPSGPTVHAAAEEAQRKAEAAMAAAINTVGKGAKPGPEGRRVLAGFLAGHIPDVASSLGAQISLQNLRLEHLAADKKSIQAAVKQIMADADARRILLAGTHGALNAWGTNAARFVGDDLASHPEMRLRDVLSGLGDVPGVTNTAKDLGDFYGVVANKLADNVKDAREAAAEIAGVMSFFVSKILGNAATTAGTLIGGGVGGVVIALGADQLGKAVESYIKNAEEELSTNDLKRLKESFLDVVSAQMEQLIAVSLWADERVRARLLAGDPPVPAAMRPPITEPPLERPGGTLRIPPPGEEPARSRFFNWFDSEAGLGLKIAAEAVVQNTGMLHAFDHRILQGLFNAA